MSPNGADVGQWVCQLPIIPNWSFLTLGFLSWSETHHMRRYHLALIVSPVGTGVGELMQENGSSLATAIAVSNKLSFVTNPGDFFNIHNFVAN